jgi:hypothetical protein
MISSDWRYDLIVHDTTGKATLPVFFLGIAYFIREVIN